MAFRLPKLPRLVPIVDKIGAANFTLQRWWQSVVNAITDALNGVDAARMEAANADSRASEALARIADALEMIATRPGDNGELARLADAIEGLAMLPVSVNVLPDYIETPFREWKFDELADAKVLLPESRQVPIWDGSYWRNGLLALDDLSDVEIDTPTTRQYLIFNGTSSLWENLDPVINDMDDVDNDTPADGHILIYNSGTGNYENTTLTAGSNIIITNAAASITVAVSATPTFSSVDATTITGSTISGTIIDTTNGLIRSSVDLADGAGAGAGTITNAPAAGNPTKWVPILDNATVRYIPAW